jgi:SAM-dependent methyltransferase
MSDYDAHYRQGGFDYDKDHTTWRNWVETHYVEEFDIKPCTKLLDVGCGDGFWAALFDYFDIEVDGIDSSPVGIEIAKRRHVDHAVFRVHDIAEPLPCPDGYFDMAFMRGLSLFHQADPMQHAHLLANVARAVKPGGMLLASLNTTLTGDIPEGAAAYHHRVSTIWAVLGTVARPVKMTNVGNYYQFAATVTSSE